MVYRLDTSLDCVVHDGFSRADPDRTALRFYTKRPQRRRGEAARGKAAGKLVMPREPCLQGASSEKIPEPPTLLQQTGL